MVNAPNVTTRRREGRRHPQSLERVELLDPHVEAYKAIGGGCGGLRDVICFSGNRDGIRRAGLETAPGLMRLMGFARAPHHRHHGAPQHPGNHKDYMCARTPWGVER